MLCQEEEWKKTAIVLGKNGPTLSFLGRDYQSNEIPQASFKARRPPDAVSVNAIHSQHQFATRVSDAIDRSPPLLRRLRTVAVYARVTLHPRDAAIARGTGRTAALSIAGQSSHRRKDTARFSWRGVRHVRPQRSAHSKRYSGAEGSPSDFVQTPSSQRRDTLPPSFRHTFVGTLHDPHARRDGHAPPHVQAAREAHKPASRLIRRGVFGRPMRRATRQHTHIVNKAAPPPASSGASSATWAGR